jgi:uncharacterized protein Yka (UPF0111/DUF47 family)
MTDEILRMIDKIMRMTEHFIKWLSTEEILRMTEQFYKMVEHCSKMNDKNCNTPGVTVATTVHLQ